MTPEPPSGNRLYTIGLAGLSLLVGACASFIQGDEIPLEGERIPVLLHERTIRTDADLKDVEILLPAPFDNADWPQAGGYPNHAMHHLWVRNRLEPVWKSKIGSSANDEQRFTAPPVVSGGVLYVMDVDHALSSYRVEDGQHLWSVDLGNETDGDDEHIPGGIAFYRDNVIATTGFGDVVSVNAQSGEIVWRRNFQSPLRAAPSARGGRIFVITLDNRILALNAINGETIWTHEGVGDGASVLGAASPAVDANLVVAPFATGELLALDVETGRLLWSDYLSAFRRTDTVSNLSQIRGNPVIDRGRIITVSNSGLMAAIDASSGERLWEQLISGIDQPWVAGDIIYVLTNDAEIAALSRETGKIYWITGIPLFEDPKDRKGLIVWSGPVLAGNRLIVAGSHGEAWALSPYSGAILGRIGLPDGVTVPPVIAGGRVYFLADNAEIVAYR